MWALKENECELQMYEYGKYWNSWDSTKEYESFEEAQAAMKERCEKKSNDMLDFA